MPTKLLRAIVGAVGEDRFDADLLESKYQLSEICGNHNNLVGFWRSNPVEVALLRETNPLREEFLEEVDDAWKGSIRDIRSRRRTPTHQDRSWSTASASRH